MSASNVGRRSFDASRSLIRILDTGVCDTAVLLAGYLSDFVYPLLLPVAQAYKERTSRKTFLHTIGTGEIRRHSN